MCFLLCKSRSLWKRKKEAADKYLFVFADYERRGPIFFSQRLKLVNTALAFCFSRQSVISSLNSVMYTCICTCEIDRSFHSNFTPRNHTIFSPKYPLQALAIIILLQSQFESEFTISFAAVISMIWNCSCVLHVKRQLLL